MLELLIVRKSKRKELDAEGATVRIESNQASH